MSNAQPPRRPWPMKWVLVAIVLMVVPYSFLRWHYRKPGKVFEPYHDIKDRANTSRLLSAGFQRITLEADRPVAASRHSAAALIGAAPGGLPDGLEQSLLERPLLAVDIGAVTAAASAATLLSYPIEFTCILGNQQQQLGGAELYVRGETMYVVPRFERLKGALLARTRDTFVRLTVPPGTMKPGHYRMVLVGANSSKAWALDVR